MGLPESDSNNTLQLFAQSERMDKSLPAGGKQAGLYKSHTAGADTHTHIHTHCMCYILTMIPQKHIYPELSVKLT